MKIIGEGENQQTIFELGDAVRINDQNHPMCGFYGEVASIDGDLLYIEQGERSESAYQSEVEAN